jgi:hypothetical protein
MWNHQPHPTEPLVSYQIDRQLSGWNNLPPLLIRALGAHGQKRGFGDAPTTFGLPRLTDIRGAGRRVSNVPTGDVCPRNDAIATFARAGRRRHAPIGGGRLFFLCPSTKPLRCSSIVYAAAEPGSRQSFAKAARSHARAAFSMEVGAPPS